MSIIKFLMLTLILLSSHAFSQESIQTDRPDMTECPYITPVHNIQVESGSFVQYNHEYDELGTEIKSQERVYPTLLAKYGLSKNFEFRFILEYGDQIAYGSKSKAEFQPFGMGCKIKICEEKGIIPTTSLISHVHLPIYTSNSTQKGLILPDFRFTCNHSLPKDLYLGYNFGGQWDNIDSGVVSFSGIYTLVLGGSISSKFGAYIEAFGTIPDHKTAEHNVDGGVTFLLTPDIQFDASVGVGIGKSNSMIGFGSLGFSFRTGRLFKEKKINKI